MRLFCQWIYYLKGLYGNKMHQPYHDLKPILASLRLHAVMGDGQI